MLKTNTVFPLFVNPIGTIKLFAFLLPLSDARSPFDTLALVIHLRGDINLWESSPRQAELFHGIKDERVSSKFLFIVDVVAVRMATAAAAASMFDVHTWHFSQIYGVEIKMRGVNVCMLV